MGYTMDHFHQAKICLETYLSRGRDAIKFLNSNCADEALEVLKWRKAAFHNFRALDQVLSQQDSNYLKHAELRQLGQEIQETDQELELAIHQQLGSLKQALIQTRETKRKIQRFHSGHQQRPEFQNIG